MSQFNELAHNETKHATPGGMRLVAILEATKAVLVLAAGFGLLELVHKDLPTMASHLVTRLHLDPASKYPHIFINAASHLTNVHLWLLASLALVYSLFRGVEAYGLWRDRAWAAWLAVVTGVIYVPLELYELSHRVTWIRTGALIINILVVVYIAYELAKSRRIQQRPRATTSSVSAIVEN